MYLLLMQLTSQAQFRGSEIMLKHRITLNKTKNCSKKFLPENLSLPQLLLRPSLSPKLIWSKKPESVLLF